MLRRFFKRSFDILFSLFIILFVFSWLYPILAILIKLESKGPVFFVQLRTGRNNMHFKCYKFRSMRVNGDADKKQATLNDHRITRIGAFMRKTSLDEIPQLFNVLNGDMSLVGPRPPLANEVGKYELEHFRRLEVLPGITGLWQVRARQDPSFHRYVALDLAYVENWSFWLDFKILIKTAGVVLRGTGW